VGFIPAEFDQLTNSIINPKSLLLVDLKKPIDNNIFARLVLDNL